LLIAERNACFKRCLTSATPCLLREILIFHWLKCFFCCWIRAYARIWVGLRGLTGSALPTSMPLVSEREGD